MRSPPGAVTNGAWQHVALSFEKLLGVARLYLNGIPVAQTNLGTFRPQTKAQMYLGGFWGGDYYTGGLDEMTVYNRALSETEILAMAEADSSGKCLEPPASECSETPYGLISWWPGDGNPNDAMGTNNVTVFTPALYAKGKVDRAFSLNGSTSRIQINSSPSLNFGTNQDFSIEMWLKAGASNTARPNMPLFEKRSTTAFPWIGYSLSLYQGRPAFTLASAPASPATMSTYIAAGPDLRDDQFHHVAVTVKRASSNGGRLYVDGQLALTFNPVPRNGSLTNSAPVYVGSSISTVSNSTFGGLIDEPAIYNRALLAGEIMADIDKNTVDFVDNFDGSLTEPDVLECHGVAGEDCYILKVRTASPKELERLIEKIRSKATVSSSVTSIVLSTFKESSPIVPCSHDRPEDNHLYSK